MKGILLIVVTLVTYAYSENVGDGASIAGMKGIEIKCDKKQQREIIKSYRYKRGFDFLQISSNENKPIEVLVANSSFQSFQKVLEKENVTYKVAHDDIRKVIVDELSAVPNLRYKRDPESFTYYPEYGKIVTSLFEYARIRHDESKIIDIGTTYEGRRIVGIKFSYGGHTKPRVIIDGGIHARDWVSVNTAMYLAWALSKIENMHMYQHVDIYIFPVINPDGYEYSRWNPDNRLWKKTRSQYINSPCFGTDIDRNFDVYWNTAGGSSDPCSENFAGPYAVSEPETQYYVKYINSLKNIKAYLSLRSYGSNLLYPYAYTFSRVKNIETLKCVLHDAKRAIYTVRQTNYDIDNFAVAVDQMTGTSIDWMMMKGRAKVSFVMNLSPGSFQFTPPLSELKQIGLETFKVLDTMLHYAEGKVCHNIDIDPPLNTPYNSEDLLYNIYNFN